MIRQPSGPIEAKVPADHPFFNLIEEAYRVFAYPKPGSIGVCERCCMDRKIETSFFNPDIRDLPLAYIQDWYGAACDAKGLSKETWAYLLPRILEILAAGEDVSNTAMEVSLNRFDTGDPENWSEREWRVLDGFQKMFLREQIEQKRDRLDDGICMFRLAGWPLDTLLDQVASAPDATLALRLWNDWCRWSAPGKEGVWITAFWEYPDNEAIFDFYASRRLYDKMEALALDDGMDGELAAKASAVASVIEANAGWSLKLP
ncbi:hypothetical protein NDN01_14730 [Sphingomonas sp. QA11]|uniref:hypothetical protein n=1 Tax=Sphingomonas sp. QA11 TaxID=2950605 RepID=UPI00234A4454|nr:hypothetical protein [Sphingomonas sp. QA11]WCM25320.1 hypothetical protein NDN01_14730 [Sphingomonas sp. QA11]